MFCVEVLAPVTMWTFTSRRAPVIPRGAPIPSWSSTTKSCGRTCRISRPAGRDTALAASMARLTSSRVISRFFPATATTPRLLNPLIWGPDNDRWTVSIDTPAISSASSMAFLIDSTAASRFTTTPRLMPRDSVTPIPTTSRRPSSCPSATTQQTVEVPTSSPTRYRSFRATRLLSSRPGPARSRPGFGQGVLRGSRARFHVHVLPKPQIDVVDVFDPVAQRLRHVQVGLQPFGELLVAEPDDHRVAVQQHGRVTRVAHVHLRQPPHQLGRPLQRDEEPAGQRRSGRIDHGGPTALSGVQPVDDREVELRVDRSELVDDRPGSIDQEELVADAANPDRLPLPYHHPDRSREDAPHGRVSDPGRLQQAAPPRLEVHRQDVAALQAIQHTQDLAARHPDIAVDADALHGQGVRREHQLRKLVDGHRHDDRGRGVTGPRGARQTAPAPGRRHVRAAESLVFLNGQTAHAAVSSSARSRRFGTEPIDPAPNVSTASPGRARAVSADTSSSSVRATDTGRPVCRSIAAARASTVTPGIGSSLAA